MAIACASGPDPIALKNRTFYEWGGVGADFDAEALEQPYQPLDISDRNYDGVQVLAGTVRMSRPGDWSIRAGSMDPGQRYIQYVSPRQVLFAIYERVESPREPWLTILQRYESDIEDEGGVKRSDPFPVATWNAQGREYLVERRVPAPKAPFVNRSREYLLRSDHRVVLVQVVHQGDDAGSISEEILPVINSLQVL